MQFQHSKGQLVNLLRVAVEPSLDLGTRQAAAISFKNLVRRDWAAGEGQCLIGYKLSTASARFLWLLGPSLWLYSSSSAPLRG